jgi:hypothetical protein
MQTGIPAQTKQVASSFLKTKMKYRNCNLVPIPLYQKQL